MANLFSIFERKQKTNSVDVNKALENLATIVVDGSVNFAPDYSSEHKTYQVGGTSSAFVPAAWQAINTITKALVSLPITVVDKDSNPIADHPLTKTFQSGGSPLDSRIAWEMVLRDFITHGNGFAILTFTGARADKLDEFEPALYHDSKWQPDAMGKRYAEYSLRSIISNESEQAKPYETNDILHLKGDNFNGLISESPMEMAQSLMDTLNQTRAATDSALRTAITARNYIEITQEFFKDLTPDQVYGMYEKVLTVLAKTGKSLPVLPAGAAIKSNYGPKIIDETLVSFHQFGVEEIARIFNIPARYLGATKNIRLRGELQETQEDFYRYCLQPRVNTIENSLTALLPIKDRRLGQRVKMETTAVTKGSFSSRVEIARQLYDSRLGSLEEAREYIGLPRDIDGERAALMPGQQPTAE